MYENELKALKRAGRFRERKVYDVRLDDLASNDYLGLSTNKKLFKKAVNYTYMYIKRAKAWKLFLAGDMAGAKAQMAWIPHLLLPLNIVLGLVALWMGVSLRGM